MADYFPAVTLSLLLVTGFAAIFSLFRPSLALILLLVSASFYLLHSSRILGIPAWARAAGDAPMPVSAIGIVSTEPKAEHNGTSAFLFRLQSCKMADREVAAGATVLVHWRGQAQIGDELSLFGTLQPIPGTRNPGEFDTRAYLARKGVNRSLEVRYPENGHVLQWQGQFSILRLAARSRDWMQRTLSRGLEDSPAIAGLICGTALGLRHQTNEDIEEPFQQTGTLHLFAVAGLHVAIVARLLWIAAAVLRLPRKIATAAIIPLLFFYAAVTGLHTASVRAATMSAILLGGIFFDRKVFALNSLAAAAFLILLWDSNQLFTSGFQLSFAVVGAIIFLADPLYRRLRPFALPDPFIPRSLLSRARRWRADISQTMARGVAVSLAAWLGSLPFIYWYFHLVTPVSLIANLAVVPLAYFVLAIAALSLVAAPFSITLSVIFNNANWLVSGGVLALVHVFALLPGGHIYLPAPGARELLFLTVLDEGTGAATHLHAHGFDWLIDCGPERTYERTLEPYLRTHGVNSLEGLCLTHGDAQHIGAAGDTVIDFSPRELYDNPLDVRSLVQKRFRAALPLRGIASRFLNRGDRLLLGKEVVAEVLYPPADLKVPSADDAPIILRLDVAGTASVLFESDAGAEAERALLVAPEKLRSEILVKGQHHAGGSGTAGFLDAVQPKLVIATSAAIPRFEAIDDTWVAELARRGIKLFRQDQTGAVTVIFNGNGWEARAHCTGEILRSKSR